MTGTSAIDELGTAGATLDRRCSIGARSSGDDPIGCSITRAHYLVMEVELPWPSEIDQARHLPAPVRELLHGYEHGNLELEFIAVAPDPAYAVPGRTRVLSLRRPQPPFSTFERAEYLVPPELLPALAETLCRRPDAVDRFDRYRVDGPPVRDLLVCTHGTQDACCATFGYPAYWTLRHEIAADVPGVRVWRASHFGGHRFAPTLCELPDLRGWGWVNVDVLRQIVMRDGPVAHLRPHYRGWAGLGFFAQVVEREIFLREGWGWLDCAKAGYLMTEGATEHDIYPVFDDEPPPPVEVRLEFRAPDGRSGAYEATVACEGRRITVGECGFGPLPAWSFAVARLELVEQTG